MTVTKGSELGITPLDEGENLSHSSKLQWSEELYLFFNAFGPIIGKISLGLIKAAKVNYDSQATQSRITNNNLSRTRDDSSVHLSPNIPVLSRRRPRSNDDNRANEIEAVENNRRTFGTSRRINALRQNNVTNDQHQI